MTKSILLSFLLLLSCLVSQGQTATPVNEISSPTLFTSLTDNVVIYDGSPWKKTPVTTPARIYDEATVYKGPSGFDYVRQYDGPVEVRWFGAIPNDAIDDAPAIQRAINSLKSVHFDRGVYLAGDRIYMGTNNGAVVYSGEGDTFTPAPLADTTVGTTIRAITDGMSSIFEVWGKGVTVKNMTIDGNYKAKIGINDGYGMFFRLMECCVIRTKEYGALVYQSAATISNCRFFANKKVGLFVFADSEVSGGSFQNGTVPLWIGCGGNRISNLNAFQGTECAIQVKFNEELFSIIDKLTSSDLSRRIGNNHFSNIYADNPVSATPIPVFRIEGSSSADRINDQEIVNLHVGTAQTGGGPYNPDSLNFSNKIAGGIWMNNTDRVTISNATFLGNGGGATATRYTDQWIRATNSESLVITNCILNGTNRNAIYLGDGNGDVTIDNCIIRGWSTNAPTTPETGQAAILQEGSIGSFNVTNNTFVIDGSSATSAYAINTADPTRLIVSGMQIRYPGVKTIVTPSGAFAGNYQRNGTTSSIYQSTDLQQATVKLRSVPLTYTPENGRLEYDGTGLYFTDNNTRTRLTGTNSFTQNITYSDTNWGTVFSTGTTLPETANSYLIQLSFTTNTAGGGLYNAVCSGVLPVAGNTNSSAVISLPLAMHAHATNGRTVQFQWQLAPTGGHSAFQMRIVGDGATDRTIPVQVKIRPLF
ncbi:right-handed parallel beta-helix repeat-containing protein [Siphonobacter aquaeclarae]|uniref:Right handed beta helix region n=1 Tax=Siphonobacter aquaeclarae TaxID=563176 RepID=A0A1G9REB6_9BACT|nr:right-handed parallel beta-helix repeat-containing protein [Siphonobacter aquaeclarae]SDM21197.1 Right handed beta helix region [Siphonobacter aquaeclarae]